MLRLIWQPDRTGRAPGSSTARLSLARAVARTGTVAPTVSGPVACGVVGGPYHQNAAHAPPAASTTRAPRVSTRRQRRDAPAGRSVGSVPGVSDAARGP